MLSVFLTPEHCERRGIEAFQPSERIAKFPEPWKGGADRLHLLAAGFTPTGKGDTVICSDCSGRLHKWRPQDNPLYEHMKNFPNCPRSQQFSKQLGRSVALMELSHTDPQKQLRSYIGQNVHKVLQDSNDFEAGRDPFTTRRSISSNLLFQPNGVELEKRAITSADRRMRPISSADSGMRPISSADSGMRPISSAESGVVVDSGRSSADSGKPLISSPADSGVVVQSGQSTMDYAGRSTMDPADRSTMDYAVQHKMQPREVKSRMDSELVHVVLDRGFSRRRVRDVIRKKLVDTGEDFESADALALAVMCEEQKEYDTQDTVPQKGSMKQIEPQSTTSSFPPAEQRQSSKNLCRHCSWNKPDVVNIPCGHMVLCATCAQTVTMCPLCDRAVKQFIKPFIA